MFPIRDHNPSSRLPVVTYGLIAINVAVFLYTFFVANGSIESIEAFYEQWALRPDEILAGEDRHTLLTSMFLHGGWMHLIGNMLFLYVFGDNLESRLGHVRYLLYYLAAGLAASALQISLTSDAELSIFNLGASGAVAGVMGGYIVLYPKAKVDVMVILFIIMRRMVMPAWVVLGLWFGLQLFSGFGEMLTVDGGASQGGVAFWAHVGGFIAGAVLVIPLLFKRSADRNNDFTNSAIDL